MVYRPVIAVIVLVRCSRFDPAFALTIISLLLQLALMQSLAAIISDARFAVTTEISEILKLMIGVKVRRVASCRPVLARLNMNFLQVWLFGSAVCDVVITVTMLIIVR